MQWLASLWANGMNGILGDEMGLGKTVQTISLIAHLYEKGVKGPFIIVAPLSTLPNWMKEFRRWTPELNAILYHGTKDDRADIRSKRLKPSKTDGNFPTIVTSFEIAMKDRPFLQRFRWKYMAIDEGHRIKNLNCRLIRELKMFPTDNRLLLTGTPLQNNLLELWSLLNFVEPRLFADVEVFQAWFDFDDLNAREGQERILTREASEQVISKLHSILKPFLLRRTKADGKILFYYYCWYYYWMIECFGTDWIFNFSLLRITS
jgi:ATP-dependent DNA helicase